MADVMRRVVLRCVVMLNPASLCRRLPAGSNRHMDVTSADLVHSKARGPLGQRFKDIYHSTERPVHGTRCSACHLTGNGRWQACTLAGVGPHLGKCSCCYPCTLAGVGPHLGKCSCCYPCTLLKNVGNRICRLGRVFKQASGVTRLAGIASGRLLRDRRTDSVQQQGTQKRSRKERRRVHFGPTKKPCHRETEELWGSSKSAQGSPRGLACLVGHLTSVFRHTTCRMCADQRGWRLVGGQSGSHRSEAHLSFQVHGGRDVLRLCCYGSPFHCARTQW
jgi:hypothetical protein